MASFAIVRSILPNCTAVTGAASPNPSKTREQRRTVMRCLPFSVTYPGCPYCASGMAADSHQPAPASRITGLLVLRLDGDLLGLHLGLLGDGNRDHPLGTGSSYPVRIHACGQRDRAIEASVAALDPVVVLLFLLLFFPLLAAQR